MTRVKSESIIEQLTSFNPQDAEAIKHLAGTVGKNYQPLTDHDMKEMITSPSTYLLVARLPETKEIVGMITLLVHRVPYMREAFLHNLVVDETHRGKGIGSQLLQAAITKAKKLHAAYVEFTSHPRRIAGNKLYEKLGFTKRETNVYRMQL